MTYHNVRRERAPVDPAMCYAPLVKTIPLPVVSDHPAHYPASPAHYPHSYAARAPSQTVTPPPEVDLCYAPRVRAIQLPPACGCRGCSSRGSPVPALCESNGLQLQFHQQTTVNSSSPSPVLAPKPGRPIPGSILYYGHGFDDHSSQQQQPHQYQNTVPTSPPTGYIDLLPPHIMFGQKHLPPAYASPPVSPSPSQSHLSRHASRTRTPSDSREFRPR
ncbi:hypothetical protein SCHPADRAFT_937482 [Schizopora paradoxa]|uniref:Uncharacterized protein n=1 Tax=Schizopora paradoxa TaxID=27342 RepID=A0A0H2SIQ4_9AGAM|nr:hypothetical protein SCHPADRAFT_937482 [Schizopora paradoxa]